MDAAPHSRRGGSMRTGMRGRIGIAIVCTLALGLVVAAPANATAVRGHQVQTSNTKYKMLGDLIGEWKLTSFHVKSTGPVFKGKGRERFTGCLDIDRDRSCA